MKLTVWPRRQGKWLPPDIGYIVVKRFFRGFVSKSGKDSALMSVIVVVFFSFSLKKHFFSIRNNLGSAHFS